MDGGLLGLLLIAGILLLTLVVVAKLGKPRLDKPHFIKKWQSIERDQSSTMAVMRADSLVDEALRICHIKGSTMGERLNNATGLITDINSVWSAHKLRNRIAHESHGEIAVKDCERALRQFKKALKDLGAL